MTNFISKEELIPEQTQIINLKIDSNYVIQGGPLRTHFSSPAELGKRIFRCIWKRKRH